MVLQQPNSGASHSTRVDVPKGDSREPMTEEEIGVKLTACRAVHAYKCIDTA